MELNSYPPDTIQGLPELPVKVLLIDGEASYAPAVSYCLAAANRALQMGSIERFADVRFSRFPETFRCWEDASGLLDSVSRCARQRDVQIIMACSDSGIRFLAKNRNELERAAAVIGTSSLEALDTAIDKANFARFASAAKLPHPETVVLQAADPLPAELPSFPALLKPARGSGGVLIRRFEEPRDFQNFAGSGGLGVQTWILQSYVPGRDIDCSVICRDGKILAHTIQRSVDCAATSFAPVGAVEFVDDDEVLHLAERLAGALQWTGIAHIDMRRSQKDSRVLVLEMNGRYWASLFGSFKAGVNFPELACLDALGASFARPVPRPIRFVRGTFLAALREARRPSETTLSWRLSDPGPLLATYLKSCARAVRSAWAGRRTCPSRQSSR